MSCVEVEATVNACLMSSGRRKRGEAARGAGGMMSGQAKLERHTMRRGMIHATSTQLSRPFAMCADSGSTTPFCSATDEMRGEVGAENWAL